MSEALLDAQLSFLSRDVMDIEMLSDYESLEELGRNTDLRTSKSEFMFLLSSDTNFSFDQ